ncbi:uncharacterized protein LOC110232539 [Exaiptasia diaphana]|uniref:E3 ubiquitin-protein ligase DZIP3 n=1 Tax=Exaiptasia diaphana TaxID=2652724 RepID=A0A913WSG8_EXADI|nr:uncharacterized protein LOC110232539 [Exaiptasia diaphana]KXJ05737.1 E3 ubiquitin-protein ligase DZIP3 [Exaiptasia diaphana]
MSGPLWTRETKQKINYTKLCRLLYHGGSKAVRSEFDKRCPSLVTVLTKEHPNLLKLKKPKGRVLNNDQWSKLYPAALADSSNFDITLLFVLLRNICGLVKPATGWDVLPPSTDNSLEANLVRIKYYRNQVVAHNSSAEVDDVDFEKYWKEISAALVSLGLQQYDIDALKSTPLGVDNYNQLLDEWYQADENVKSQLKRIYKDTSESRLDVKKVKQEISETKTIVAEIKQRIPHCLQPEDQEIDKLAQRDFSTRVTKLCQSYHPSTRKWIFDDVHKHTRESIVLQAGPGMGKSVVAAKLCQFYKEKGNLGACHFFQHDNSLHNDPRLMLQSVARQLCDSLPDYKAAVEKQLKTDFGKEISKLNCKELFTLLFEEPCSTLRSQRHVVIIIDALDECCNSLKTQFFEVLNDLPHLPSFFQFILTTRPPPSFSAIHIGHTLEIKPDIHENKCDLRIYFSEKLRELGYRFSGHHSRQINHLVDVTNGLFLVASFVIDFLRDRNCSSLTEAIDHFPKGKGITSVYENYFSRLRKAMIPHIKSEKGFFEMLDAVVEAKYPIQKNIFYDIVGLVDEPRVPNRERKEAIHLLHQLFPVENDHVSAFHKTVIDWLTTGDHDFRVKGDGSGVLANACYEILNSIKEGSKDLEQPLCFTEREEHALRFGKLYMDSPTFSEYKRTATKTSCLLLCFIILRDQFFKQDSTQSHLISWMGYKAFNKGDWIMRVQKYIVTYTKRYHFQKCQFYNPINLSRLLETVLQSLHLNHITRRMQLNQKPIDLLKEYGFPYQERQQSVMELHMTDTKQFDVQNILPCENGFLFFDYNSAKKETLVQKYKVDGKLLIEETLSGHKKLCMSPDNQYIFAFPVLAKGYIEIMDAARFQLQTSYQAPNVIRSCHVYGSQPWYIVMRCHNNKIYVMDGETGKEAHQPVDIDHYDEVEAVSSQGHIVIGRACLLFPMRDSTQKIITSDKGTVFEEMIWGKGDNHNTPIQCRKLFLCHFDESSEFIKMPIYPRQRVPQCNCLFLKHSEWRKSTLPPEEVQKQLEPQHLQYEAIKFSSDGQLLAFVYKNFITVLHTNDYSELASFQHYLNGRNPGHGICEILFLTKDFIVINDLDSIYCIRLETKDVEHMFTIYHNNNNRTPLQLYIVPGFVERKKVFLSITKGLTDKKKPQSLRLFLPVGHERQTDRKDERIHYIYKHSIYDLQLENE